MYPKRTISTDREKLREGTGSELLRLHVDFYRCFQVKAAKFVAGQYGCATGDF